MDVTAEELVEPPTAEDHDEPDATLTSDGDDEDESVRIKDLYVDTSVLFPFSVMDLMLALSENAVHQVLWTDYLLDEWQRVIVRERQRTPETAASVVETIREFFADCKIDRASYEQLISEMPGDDPDDHPHMAAAVAAGVDVLVTNDRAGFPAAALAERGIRVCDPGTYLCELLDDQPDELIATFIGLAAEKNGPLRTPEDLLQMLRQAGVPNFTDRLAPLI